MDAKLVGKVTGVPCPTVSWSKDGLPLREGARLKIKRDGELAVLFIQDSQADDSGRYEAIAENCEGSAKCAAQLNIVDKV